MQKIAVSRNQFNGFVLSRNIFSAQFPPISNETLGKKLTGLTSKWNAEKFPCVEHSIFFGVIRAVGSLKIVWERTISGNHGIRKFWCRGAIIRSWGNFGCTRERLITPATLHGQLLADLKPRRRSHTGHPHWGAQTATFAPPNPSSLYSPSQAVSYMKILDRCLSDSIIIGPSF